MNCIRYIKLKTLRLQRRSRRMYIDDKGNMHELKHSRIFKHEQRCSRIKGENFRGGYNG
jgi:hypothetical protein